MIFKYSQVCKHNLLLLNFGDHLIEKVLETLKNYFV